MDVLRVWIDNKLAGMLPDFPEYAYPIILQQLKEIRQAKMEGKSFTAHIEALRAAGNHSIADLVESIARLSIQDVERGIRAFDQREMPAMDHFFSEWLFIQTREFSSFVTIGLDGIGKLEEQLQRFTSSLSKDKREIWEGELNIIFTVSKHGQVLYNTQQRLIYKDDFGDLVFDEWYKYRENYIRDKLGTYIGHNSHLEAFAGETVEAAIYLHSKTENNKDNPEQTAIDGSDFLAYEKSCVSVLETKGWDVTHLGGSGDQGADIIAKLPNRTVVIQCKLWKGPISNKAIQEVFTAKAFYNADTSVVVSNATYTKSARQLANKLGVLLLHHKELYNLREIIEN